MPYLDQTLTPDTPLTGDFNPELEARKMGPSFRVKGMYFTQLGRELGPAFAELQTRFVKPPRLGRYLPFSDYPQHDYALLAAAVAGRKFPACSLKEGIRRVSRNDFHVFAESTLGRVVLAAVGDARTALLHVPKVYSTVATGDWEILASEVGSATVRVEFRRHPSVWAYQLGQLEGIVLAFNRRPRIHVREQPGDDVQFDVELL